MYSAAARGEAYIQRLCAFIGRAYPLRPTAIAPARRGYYGETWRLDCGEGRCFLKLDRSPHQTVYARNFPVVEHLRNRGMEFVSRIVKARDGRLFTQFDGGVLGVFDWIEGENRQDESTKTREYQMLARVYTVDAAGLDLAREDFLPRAADLFFSQWARVEDKGILALLEQRRDAIGFNAGRLRHFARLCQEDLTGFAITHGDAGGNVIVNGDAFYLVDWDDPWLAPPERDAWFCMQWPWAMETFQAALRQNGIGYTLRSERLAYYCYHMYFFYLMEILDTFFALGPREGAVLEYLSEYLGGWINDNLAFAGGI